MSKWYEVAVTRTSVYCVEIEDHEDLELAIDYAQEDRTVCGDVSVDSYEILNNRDDIDASQRHCDKILPI